MPPSIWYAGHALHLAVEVVEGQVDGGGHVPVADGGAPLAAQHEVVDLVDAARVHALELLVELLRQGRHVGALAVRCLAQAYRTVVPRGA